MVRNLTAAVEVGYIEPGHGVKGRKQRLLNDEDVREMYSKHVGKQSILLWAYSQVKISSKKVNLISKLIKTVLVR